jgi:hypothetical protein
VPLDVDVRVVGDVEHHRLDRTAGELERRFVAELSG